MTFQELVGEVDQNQEGINEKDQQVEIEEDDEIEIDNEPIENNDNETAISPDLFCVRNPLSVAC